MISMHRALGSISATHTHTYRHKMKKTARNVIPTHVKAFLSHILKCHSTNHEAEASNCIGIYLSRYGFRYMQFTIRYTDKPGDSLSDNSLTNKQSSKVQGILSYYPRKCLSPAQATAIGSWSASPNLKFIVVDMDGHFACIQVCADYLCLMLTEARRGIESPWKWSYRQL